jgi:hypothetical protein
MKKTKTITRVFTEGTSWKFNCLAVEFFVPANVSGGTTYNNVSVGGRTLTPGSSFSVNQLEGCVDETQYDILFSGNDTSELQATYVVVVGKDYDQGTEDR